MSADQTGGGEGGKTTEVSGNQMSLSRGSAEMTVTCGRLQDKQDRTRAPAHTTEMQQGLLFLEMVIPLPSLSGVVSLAGVC